MDKKLQDKLYKKYPKIFVQHKLPCTETAMCWGFECDDGWYNLIDMLCGLIQWDIDENGYPEITASQVKEKYGTLRFYTSGVYKKEKHYTFKAIIKKYLYNFLRNMMYKFCKERYQENEHYHTQKGMIRFAEYLSAFVCEKCGSNSNVTQTKDWIITLCDKCAKEYNDRNRT